MNADIEPTRETIPSEMRERPTWVCWRIVIRDGKTTKVPVKPGTGTFASPSDPDSWADFETAWSYHDDSQTDTDGIGYVFMANGPYVGVDLDDCRDPETGHLDDWALDIVDRLASWTYVSSSGTGVHVVVKGDLPDGGNRSGNVEMYETTRFFAVTGVSDPLNDQGVATADAPRERQAALEAVHEEHVAGTLTRHGDGNTKVTATASEPASRTSDLDLADDELLDRARDAANGNQFRRLFDHGDTSGYPSHSEARFALLGHLAFWTRGDRRRIDHLFRESALYPHPDKPGKWDRVGETEIEKVLTGKTEFYEPTEPPAEQASLDTADPWRSVRALFNSDDNGSTTRGYNVAADAVLVDESLVCVRETDELYRYDPEQGYYRRKGKSYIRERLREAIPKCVNNNRMKNIIERVRDRCYLDQQDFTPPDGKVVVENGVLDLDTRELEPFTPDYYFTAGLACEYDPEATAEEWDETLCETVATDGARATLQEFVGYCLEVWHHKRAKNMFAVGPTASGKSTFVDTVAALFGDDPPSVTNLTPQQLADTQFDRSTLAEAALNARNDINATKIEDSGTLKTIFAGERVKMERKYQDPTFGAPDAKHLFSANWLPRVVGEDESIYRRVLIVEFPDTIPREERDLGLKERLREHDLPGILNWALDGRDRLQEQDGFTRDRSLMDTRMTWLSWRSAPLRFLFERCEITGDSDDTVERKSAYQAYKEWAARNGFDIRPQQSMTNYWKQVPHVEVTSDNGMDVFAGIRFPESGTGTSGDLRSQLPQALSDY